jgi:hypothetical protein
MEKYSLMTRYAADALNQFLEALFPPYISDPNNPGATIVNPEWIGNTPDPEAGYLWQNIISADWEHAKHNTGSFGMYKFKCRVDDC